MQSSSIQLNQIPRLLNEKFSIVSYDGGVFEEGGMGGNFDIKNVLIPSKDSFHCSDAGTRKNLVLKCATDFTLTHVFIQAPRRKCTEPIRNCLVWVSDVEPSVSGTRFYDDMSIDVIRAKFADGEPIVVSTARETLEGETEIRPWRSGRFVHIKLFDTHSDTQENVDIAVIGLVGFSGTVPFYNPLRKKPSSELGPWLKRQLSVPRQVHQHSLTSTFSNRGWCCDGRDFSGGCRGGFNDFNETSVYDVSLRCSVCGFDLCEYCAADKSFGKVTKETAFVDMSLLRDSSARNSAQAKRLVFNRIRNSLRTDPNALFIYLTEGIMDMLGKFKYVHSRDSVMLLSTILSRLSPASVGCGKSQFVPDLFLNFSTDEVVQISPTASGDLVPFTGLADGSAGAVSKRVLIPFSNSETVVRNTGKLFELAMKFLDSPNDIDTLIASADLSIPNAAGEFVIDIAASHGVSWLVEKLASTVQSTESGEEIISMEIEEEGIAPATPLATPPLKSREAWLAELRHLINARLVDQLSESDSADPDLLECLVETNSGFSEKIRALVLRLLNGASASEVLAGLRLISGVAKRSSGATRETLTDFGALEWCGKIRKRWTSHADVMGDEIDAIEDELGSTTCGEKNHERIVELLQSSSRISDEAEVSSICEYLLLKEELPVRKFLIGDDRNRQGFTQLSSLINVKVPLSPNLAEVPMEPIAALGDVRRMVLTRQPVRDIDYIRFCYELIGCVLHLRSPPEDPALMKPVSGASSPAAARRLPSGIPTPVQTASGEGLVTGFDLVGDMQLGLHAMVFNHPVPTGSSGKRQVLLSLRDFEVVRRDSSVIPHLDLKAKLTLERLLDSACVNELKDIRPLLDHPGELVVVENARSRLHNILPLVGLTHSPRGWLVPTSGVAAEVLVVLDSSFRVNIGSIASPLPTPQPALISIDEEKIFSVAIQVDTNEIPFELIWPMIRHDISEAIRPHLARSWPNLTTVSRIEQQVAAGVNNAGGQGVIARALTRSEAEFIARRVGNVVQTVVFEDGPGAIAAETERQTRNREQAGGARGSSGPVRQIGSRVKWTPPSMLAEDKWLIGTIVAIKDASYDIIDEASAALYANVPKACVGEGAGAMRQRLRDNLRRRFMDVGNLFSGGASDLGAPALVQIGANGSASEDEAGLLQAFAGNEEYMEDEEEEEEEEDEDHYEEIMRDMESGTQDVFFGSSSEAGGMSPGSESSPRQRRDRRRALAGRQARADSAASSTDDISGGLGGVMLRGLGGNGGPGSLLISIGDLLAGIGLGGIDLTAGGGNATSETVTRVIPGLQRGNTLNGPIGERYAADELLLQGTPRDTSVSPEKRSRIIVSLRAAGGEWIELDSVTEQYPLLSLVNTMEVVPKSLEIELSVRDSAETGSGSGRNRTKRQRVSGVSSASDEFIRMLEQLERKSDRKTLIENPLFQLLKTTIVRKIQNQLDQVLVTLSEALVRDAHRAAGSVPLVEMLPSWLHALPERLVDLVPESVRQKIFFYSSLRTSFTVHWLQHHHLGELMGRRSQIQTDLNTESASLDPSSGRRIQHLSQELSNVEDRIVRNAWWTGCIKSCLAKLRKSDPSEFVAMSGALLKRISNSSSMLEIQFEGESGFGSAVTRSFFSEIGKEFMKPGPLCLWLTSGETTGDFIQVGKRGLRLRPILAVTPDQTNACKMLGRLIGRAMAEGYIVPLPISVDTWAMIRDPSAERPIEALPMPGDGCSGEFVGACAVLMKRVREESKSIDQVWPSLWQNASVPFDDMGAVYVETGFSGLDLIPGGQQKSVTTVNVGDFVDKASHYCLRSGVEAQISAIRQGIDEVFPVDSLLLFSPLEVKTLICGEEEIVWDESSLREMLNFHDMGTDRLANWLVEVLVEMSNQQRSTFLDFVTSCPRLPPGGVLRIEVFPETIAASNLTSPVLRPTLPPLVGNLSPLPSLASSGNASPPGSGDEATQPIADVVGYPRSRACVNHLYLPRYKTKKTLKDRLIEAMVSSVHHDEITG